VTAEHPPAPGQSSAADARNPDPDSGRPALTDLPALAAGLPVPGLADLPGPESEAEWGRAVKILGGATEICLACHVRPDGDALGSMLAVAHALRARGAAGQPPAPHPPRHSPSAVPLHSPFTAPARVVASFGDLPFEIPRILRFLPGTDLLIPPDAFPERPQVMVTFDAASADRLGILQASASAADELIVIDHHASNTRFGSVNLIDQAAAATAVLAFDLIGRLGVGISRDIALGLYAGLVTDTGSFKYSNTSPRVHELAALLLRAGIEPGAVAHELWDRSPFGFLGLLGAALGRARLEPAAAAGHGVVWTTVTHDDRAAHGLPFEVAESVIDVVRRTDEADVAVVLKEEDDDGCWQVSARSKGAVDVGRACVALGGGGHRLAAGFTARGTAAEVMTTLRNQLATGPGAVKGEWRGTAERERGGGWGVGGGG
jgi:bifunctional oligoribonuclease and PAP phosphatase NrnA